MATQLFFRSGVGTAALATTHRGTNTAPLAGGTSGWEPRPLALTRGPSLAGFIVNTVTGPTAGIEVPGQLGAFPAEFLSDPVAADVTISGTITANLWGNESSMTANVAINVVIDILRSDGSIVQIVKSTFTTELATTTSSANNFTTGMTSGSYTAQTLNRGDRLRIRVFGDDSAAATMATGFQFTFHHNGPTAGASGDSYVTFTENITFDVAPGAEGAYVTQNVSSSSAAIGGPTAASEGGAAQSFLAPSIGSITRVELRLQKIGTPTDNINVEIRTDSGTGIPTSTVLASASMAASGISATNAFYSFSVPVSLTSGVTYWIVVTRSGAIDASNYIVWHHEPGAGPYADGVALTANAGGTWFPGITGDFRFIIYAPTVAGSVIYLTDTASDVATASVDREAWTSRGGGVVNDVTNTAAGFTTPIQVTDTAGGTVVDWFTKPLQAVTLTGMAVGNIRALESAVAANASIRCEIARVNGDGTSPTVWASWCISADNARAGELNTSESAETVNVSGDDLAITNGQRLRIRLYIDDMPTTAMGASQTVTTYYNGTSGGASGDTYITFPVVLAEFVSASPGPASSRRQRRASRYLTFR